MRKISKRIKTYNVKKFTMEMDKDFHPESTNGNVDFSIAAQRVWLHS
jgi:hypothetical protein